MSTQVHHALAGHLHTERPGPLYPTRCGLMVGIMETVALTTPHLATCRVCRRRSRRPKCYGCDQRAARGRRFCTVKCAALYGEELVRGNDDEYCPTCDAWEYRESYSDTLRCGHPKTGIEEG